MIVKISELKRILTDIYNITKNRYSTAVFQAEMTPTGLIAEAAGSVQYRAVLAGKTGEASSPAIYRVDNAYEILPDSGEAQIHKIPEGLRVTVNNLVLVISSDVLGSVEPIQKRIGGQQITIPAHTISATDKLAAITTFNRIYKKNYPILCDGRTVRVQYPSVWVIYDAPGLKGVLSPTCATILAKFLKTAENPQITESKNALFVTQEDTELVVPITEYPEPLVVEQLLGSVEFSVTADVSNLRTLTKTLVRILKYAGDIACYITEDEISISINTPNITLNTHTTGRILHQFTTKVEFLSTILALVPDTVTLMRRKDGTTCIKGPEILVLLSRS